MEAQRWSRRIFILLIGLPAWIYCTMPDCSRPTGSQLEIKRHMNTWFAFSFLRISIVNASLYFSELWPCALSAVYLADWLLFLCLYLLSLMADRWSLKTMSRSMHAFQVVKFGVRDGVHTPHCAIRHTAHCVKMINFLVS